MRNLGYAVAMGVLAGCFTDHHAGDGTEGGSSSSRGDDTLPTAETTAGATDSGATATTSSSADDASSTSTATSDASSSTGDEYPWVARRELSIDALRLGAVIDDFPLLVVLRPDRIEYELCQPAGEDLRFWLPDEIPLAFEIEEWNPDGISIVWVRVPRIDADNDTIFMDYGNPDAPDAQDPAAVWADRYVAVWHMQPDDPLTPATFADATGLGHSAALVGGDAGNIATGPLGSSAAFDGNETLQVATTADLQGGVLLTVEAWIRPTGIGATSSSAVDGGSYGLFAARLPGGLATWFLSRELDDAYLDSVAAVPLDDWTFLAGTFNDEFDRIRLYYNDEDPLTAPVLDEGAIQASLVDLVIGAGFLGQIDEVRIAGAEHEPEYLQGQYLASTDQLVAFGEPFDP